MSLHSAEGAPAGSHAVIRKQEASIANPQADERTLLSVAPEILDNIVKFYLGGGKSRHYPIILMNWQSNMRLITGKYTGMCQKNGLLRHELGRVCKVLYEAVTKAYYGDKIWAFKDATLAFKWLEQIGSLARSSIKSLEIRWMAPCLAYREYMHLTRISSRLFEQVKLCSNLKKLHLGVGRETMKGLPNSKRNNLFDCGGVRLLIDAITGRGGARTDLLENRRLKIEVREYLPYGKEAILRSSPDEIVEFWEDVDDDPNNSAHFSRAHVQEFEEAMQKEINKTKEDLLPQRKRRANTESSEKDAKPREKKRRLYAKKPGMKTAGSNDTRNG